MNVLAHVWVANSLSPDPEVLLGAALPDLASMARTRLDPAAVGERLGLGWELHRVTDRVFHQHPAFLGGSRRAVGSLVEAGVGRGAARAVAHAGWELLLDGVLLERSGARGLVDEPLALARRLPPGTFAHPERWGAFALRLGDWDWSPYLTAADVCGRIEAILSRRPLLAMQPQERPAVLSALEELRAEVVATGEEVVAAVTEAVGAWYSGR